jgi:hypothetical protein
LLILLAGPARADTIDHPSVGRALRGTARVTGGLSVEHGFVSYRYRALRSGFAKITLATGEKQPYLRVLAVPSEARRGEGWSTNTSTLVVRVAAGDELEVIVTVAENITRGHAVAAASYELVAEVMP